MRVQTFHSTRTLMYVAWTAVCLGFAAGQLVAATYRPSTARPHITVNPDNVQRVPGIVLPRNRQRVEV